MSLLLRVTTPIVAGVLVMSLSNASYGASTVDMSCIEPTLFDPPTVLKTNRQAVAFLRKREAAMPEVDAYLVCLRTYRGSDQDKVANKRRRAFVSELVKRTEEWNAVYGEFLDGVRPAPIGSDQ